MYKKYIKPSANRSGDWHTLQIRTSATEVSDESIVGFGCCNTRAYAK